jgi:hypothetical protein
MWLGAVVLVGTIVGGLFYIAAKQKGGLHEKAHSRVIRVHSPNLKKLTVYARKTTI